MGKHLTTLVIGGLLSCVVAYFGLDQLFQPTDQSGRNESAATSSEAGSTARVNPASVAAPATHGVSVTDGSNASSRTTDQHPSAGSQIVVGTFNIQVFGKKKIADQAVMNVITRIARYFDVLAIQEIRERDQTVLPRFVQMLNADGSRYDYRIGKRQGRTSSKEQYVFIWNTRTVDLIQETWYAPDPEDIFHREPMIASFRCRGPHPQQAFSFSLMNIHTDPHEAREELDGLADAYRQVQFLQGRQVAPEDDIIVLGDFNLSPRKYGRFGQIPGLFAVIPSHVKTNVSGTENYDNIVFQRDRTAEFIGQAGVFDLTGEPFYLNTELAKRVSDHYPVWAVFSVYENRNPVAQQATANGY